MNQILIVNISSLLIIIILSIVVLIKSNKNKLVMYLAIFTIIIGVGSLTYCLINSISNDGYKVINLNTNKNFNAFEDYFWHKKKKLKIHKWHHYFKIYDCHFNKYIGKKPVILEIGVQNGGSLEMWNHYFNNKCTIYGIDIDKTCLDVPKKLNSDNITVTIGDQNDRNFWKNYLKDKPKFDIVIEDGGHTMSQQITTYEELIDHMAEDGVYLCEDLHTSYWQNYGGDLKNPNTFIEYSKNFIDMLNYYHIPDGKLNSKENEIYSKFRKMINSVHYYDSIIVLELNKDHKKPMATVRN